MQSDTAAVGFLLLVAVAPLVWAGVALARSPYDYRQSVLYFMCVLLTKLLWRTRIRNRLPVESGCGAVIVANHTTSVDPFFIQIAVGRVCHWMVAREYCEHRVFSWLLTPAEAIPTNRAGIDTAATKQAIRFAAEGQLVGMLPEGRINTTGQLLLPVRPGAAMVALHARVPVVPVYIKGAPFNRTPWSPMLMSARVEVTFGDPIDLSPYYDRIGEDGLTRTLTLQFMTEIARLAGHDDYRPTLAGRKWKTCAKSNEP